MYRPPLILIIQGIEYGEGPGKEGQRGPYIQSERLEIYNDYIRKLLKNGSAYHCFCTERRLNILRRDAVKLQRVPKYDNRCRNLPPEEVERKIKSGVPYCIRFKLTSDCQYYEDLVFGAIAYDVSLNEGDPVLMKGDGFPTYHFANVVDDHLMGITHVLRGVEWQISTTKHLLIYRAFGWTAPAFGHLPLIVNSDGTKLSKRQSDVRVEDYRSGGVFPLALVNYITLSGGGFDHVVGQGVHLKTMGSWLKSFRLELKRRLQDHTEREDLLDRLQSLIKENYPGRNLNVSRGHLRNVLVWAVARITRVEELATAKFGFLWILPSAGQARVDSQLLGKLVHSLEGVESFDEEPLKGLLRSFSAENGVQFPVLMKMLRSALSGLNEGPGVAEMMHLLGKNQSLERIKAAIR
ncbi:unnamed protein product, partial [Iphiclides podalirius]